MVWPSVPFERERALAPAGAWHCEMLPGPFESATGRGRADARKTWMSVVEKTKAMDRLAARPILDRSIQGMKMKRISVHKTARRKARDTEEEARAASKQVVAVYTKPA